MLALSNALAYCVNSKVTKKISVLNTAPVLKCLSKFNIIDFITVKGRKDFTNLGTI
jgi:hypothetical protein